MDLAKNLGGRGRIYRDVVYGSVQKCREVSIDGAGSSGGDCQKAITANELAAYI